jgi:hypothetical protein
MGFEIIEVENLMDLVVEEDHVFLGSIQFV